jgi:hypothetical protein
MSVPPGGSAKKLPTRVEDSCGSPHGSAVRLLRGGIASVELTGPEYSEYVFFNDRNLSAHLLKLPKTWKGALKSANIGYFPIYNLRHTFATRM